MRRWSTFRPVVLRYPDGTEETGIELDIDTVEARRGHLFLQVGDVIAINGERRQVVDISVGRAIGRRAGDGIDRGARIRHAPAKVEPRDEPASLARETEARRDARKG